MDGNVTTLADLHHVVRVVLDLHRLPARETHLRIADTGEAVRRTAPHLDGLVPQIPAHATVFLPYEVSGVSAILAWLAMFEHGTAHLVVTAHRAETSISLSIHTDHLGMQWKVWTSLSRSTLLPGLLGLTHAKDRVIGVGFLRAVLGRVLDDRREVAR